MRKSRRKPQQPRRFAQANAPATIPTYAPHTRMEPERTAIIKISGPTLPDSDYQLIPVWPDETLETIRQDIIQHFHAHHPKTAVNVEIWDANNLPDGLKLSWPIP